MATETGSALGQAQVVERVQELTEQLESLPDPFARSLAEELAAGIVQMYGAGLERVVSALAGSGPGGRELLDSLAADEIVGGLLMIHDLHPVPLEERAAQALERVRPYMESHGGDVELLGVEDGVARLRLQGSCKSCRASSSTLELAVRQALEELCPDLEGMDVEGILEEEPVTPVPGTPLPMAGGGTAPPLPSWTDVAGLAGLGPEQMASADVGGFPLLVANVEGTLLAYRNECADCHGVLDGGQLAGGALTCPGCGRSYFLPRAGRSLDGDDLQLGPVPLLRDNGSVKVALSR